jgi:hypothetical protein
VIHALQERLGTDPSRTARKQGVKISVPRALGLQRHAVSILTDCWSRTQAF